MIDIIPSGFPKMSLQAVKLRSTLLVLRPGRHVIPKDCSINDPSAEDPVQGTRDGNIAAAYH